MDFTDDAESVQFGFIPTQHTIERKICHTYAKLKADK